MRMLLGFGIPTLQRKSYETTMISKEKFYELYNKNSPHSRWRNLGAPDVRWFARDVSLPIAYYCAKKGISANTVTLIFFALSVGANFLLIIPIVETLVFLIVIHELALILDCVDGQLARHQRSFSRWGEMFDSFTHAFIDWTFMLALGARLYLEHGSIPALILGGIGGGARVFDFRWNTEVPVLIAKTYAPQTWAWLKKFHFIYLFDEVRIFTAVLLLVSLIEERFPLIPLVETIFAGYVLYSLGDRTIYKAALLLKQVFRRKRRQSWRWS